MYCIKNKGRTRTLHTFQFLHNIKENMPRFQGLLSLQTHHPSFKLVQGNLRFQRLRVQNPSPLDGGGVLSASVDPSGAGSGLRESKIGRAHV